MGDLCISMDFFVWVILHTVAFVGTHFSPQFPENSRSQSNACNTLISSKKNMQLLNGKGNNNSTENLSGITDDHQSYE